MDSYAFPEVCKLVETHILLLLPNIIETMDLTLSCNFGEPVLERIRKDFIKILKTLDLKLI